MRVCPKTINTSTATKVWNWPNNLFVNLFGIAPLPPDNLEVTVLKAMDIALNDIEKEIIIYFYKDKLDRFEISCKVNLPAAKVSNIRSTCLRKLYQNRFSRYILIKGIDQAVRKMHGPILEWDISFLHMPMRFYNSIDTSMYLIGVDKDIETIRDLIALSREDILKASGIGEKTLNLLENKLADYGLYLKKEE